jgi:hypothetical protein
VDQLSLLADLADPDPDEPRFRQTMRVLIAVTAAPNPSQTHGETVCVAGLRLDPGHEQWIRLCPVNLRHLGGDRFRKYDVLDIVAAPQTRNDQRLESWAPELGTLDRVGHIDGWPRRMAHMAPFVRADMCAMVDAARQNPRAASLGLVRPVEVLGFDIEPHPGWTNDEQARIDAYVNQLDLFGEDRSPLQAPRFRGWYRYRCSGHSCGGHRQGLIDWEFIAHQRRLAGMSDDDAVAAMRQRWLQEICRTENDVLFYVGNQAKRRHVFSTLGVMYPRRAG